MLRPSDGVLARFTRDLTADARRGRLDVVHGRETELARLVDILLRRDKNNPVLVGEAGVGKTAIAEALAQRLATDSVPLSLRGRRLLALDHMGLLGGTMYRGQYEERLRGLVEEIEAAGDVILFVDELHNLMGQGTAVGVAMDAANMLKPALTRGGFRVVGATTAGEYDRWIRPDPALERRFQPVIVRELSSDETAEVLEARREVLERHHFVVIADGAVKAAVRLTDLFQPDRRRPDRALDALDEACAHVHAGATYAAATEEIITRLRADDAARRRPPPAPFWATPAGWGAALDAADAADAADAPAPDLGSGRRTPPDDPPPSSTTDGPATTDERRSGAGTGDELSDADPLVRLAREGVAALGRLGAELDAAFGVGGQSGETARDAGGTHHGTAAGTGSASSRRHDQWSGAGGFAELRDRLIEEGVVVRGHDVARVVSLITGKNVTWVD
ncbi:MAG: AAA family ATPase [Gemmatimonadaceae bacterium]